MPRMLTLWRRHTPACPHRDKGRRYEKCSCPIWLDGILYGKRYRRSASTRDWQKAKRKRDTLESPDSPIWKPVDEAVGAWLNHKEIADSSRLRYQRIMRRLEEFCRALDIEAMCEFTLELLDRFRASRRLARTTSARELQVLRQFFGFCKKRKWVTENWAKELEPPADPKPREVVPYTTEQMACIFSGCDRIGQSPYERLRARAMVLLMRHTGLRISGVMMLLRNRVRDGQVQLFTQKTAGFIWLPVPAELEAALANLPLPLAADGTHRDSGYFFWNGLATKRSLMGDASRALRAVFRVAGVPGAHAHRFRHTLATEVLARGGTLQDVADILGISVKVAEKHYEKWSPARQERIFGLMRAVQSGTAVAQRKKGAVIN